MPYLVSIDGRRVATESRIGFGHDAVYVSTGWLNGATLPENRDNPLRCSWDERVRKVVAAYNRERGI